LYEKTRPGQPVIEADDGLHIKFIEIGEGETEIVDTLLCGKCRVAGKYSDDFDAEVIEREKLAAL
jgi:hypothetical protein